MTDRFTEAEMELQDKSPFVCDSCGHPHDIAQVKSQVLGKPVEGVHDRFSEAISELPEKSAFTCESCGKKKNFLTRLLH